MFKQQREQWDLAQDQMAAVKPVFRPTMGGMGAQGRQIESIKPPPPGYTCFRCGEKGHFINACPTIGDKDFDNKPKIKKATGIPSMFLKTITNKDSFEGAMMVTQDGDLVQAVPNDDSWKRMQAQGFHNLGADSAYNTAPILPELQCHICQRLLRDAVESPCCNTSYCEPCISP